LLLHVKGIQGLDACQENGQLRQSGFHCLYEQDTWNALDGERHQWSQKRRRSKQATGAAAAHAGSHTPAVVAAKRAVDAKAAAEARAKAVVNPAVVKRADREAETSALEANFNRMRSEYKGASLGA
jgi:hypothetical protein